LTERKSDTRYSWMQDALAAGAVIVTASRRLARDLSQAHGEQQLAAGAMAWLTPPVFYWQDWIQRLLAEVSDPLDVPRRLDNYAAAVLWERCLRGRAPADLMSFRGIVRQAGIAWQRLSEWNVTLPALRAAARNEDERFYFAAAADYQDQLDQGNWVDGAGATAVCAALVRQGQIPVPASLVIAGFDRQSPVIGTMLDALAAAGCETTAVPPAGRSGPVGLATFDHEAAELRAAGAWARVRLDDSPGARIAIVHPELESRVADVTRLVREGLAPGWQYGDAGHEAAVNVSYGRRFSDYPGVAVALLLLRWVCGGLPGRELSVLLRSQCIAGREQGERCRLELHLREYPDREWSAADLRSVFGNESRSGMPAGFRELIETVARAGETAGDPLSPAASVERIDGLLKACGWPGDDSLDSREFQLVNRWRELLNEFGRVDGVLPTLTLADAIRRISGLAADTIWQPEAGPGIVQLLGPLEAAGMEFDGIWVSGMDATQWPPPSRPSPLISLQLQRRQQMPDATPADTLQFSRRILQRLTAAAADCVLSWSRAREDAELAASTLLEDLEVRAYDGPGDPGWFAQRLAGTARSERIDDDGVAAVQPDEQVGGGAYTVQQQFQQPFTAFVHGRLGVRLPDAFRSGLTPSIRGNIIHNALHSLLADKPAQADIAAWNDQARAERIGSAIDTALGLHVRYADSVLQRMLGIERSRLFGLAEDFLRHERERDIPFEIDALEHSLRYERSGVSLGFRIDRVDRLPDGRVLVIDYKTGAPKTFLRQSGDLKDVQLVVYADALDEPIAGLVLINIDSREISYKGAGGGWNATQEDAWAATLDSWCSQVHVAMAGLAAGDIRLNRLQSVADGRPLGVLSRLEALKRDG
jgi:probable DNA repair protein